MALVQASAMDVVLADCGAPRLLTSLKCESAPYKGNMLLFLVGRAWQTVRLQDASAIDVPSLVRKWAEASA